MSSVGPPPSPSAPPTQPQKKPLPAAMVLLIAIVVSATVSFGGCALCVLISDQLHPATVAGVDPDAAPLDMPAMGAEGFLYAPGCPDTATTVLVFPSEEELRRDDGRNAVPIACGTRIKRLEGGLLFSRIEAVAGPSAGKGGWVENELIHTHPFRASPPPPPDVPIGTFPSPPESTIPLPGKPPPSGASNLKCRDGTVSRCASRHRGCCHGHGGFAR